jgi:hypothetical protein
MTLKSIFTPDYVRYEGVRPFHIGLLRTVYFLMAAFVAPVAWRELLTHEGPWSPTSAAAWCVWATYPTLAILGLIHPLRMLPLMLFTVGYKALWLYFVAFPLWQSNTLVGSPAEQMTKDFLWLPLALFVMPWKYIYNTYVKFPTRAPAPDAALTYRINSQQS